MQRSTLKNILLFLPLLLAFSLPTSAIAEKDKFLELRGGIGSYNAHVTNKTYNFSFPCVDITFGANIGYMQSVFSFSFFGATTNAKQKITFDDGTVLQTNSKPTNRYFVARAFSIEFGEYFPFSFLGDKLKISPGIDIKFAHYNDVSAMGEFTKPTKDYMYTFLRLALKAEFKFTHWGLGTEYRYPLLGSLTDKLLKENRYETYLNIYGRYDYTETLYLKFGYDYSKLTYHNTLLNSVGQSYSYRSRGTLYLTLGFNF